VFEKSTFVSTSNSQQTTPTFVESQWCSLSNMSVVGFLYAKKLPDEMKKADEFILGQSQQQHPADEEIKQ
jgi:hypothetical protein